MTDTAAEYLGERGFRRGRYCSWSRDEFCINELRQTPGKEGWMAFTVAWELGPFPDPITAFIAAELADWGRP